MKLAVILLLAFIFGVGGYLAYQAWLPSPLNPSDPVPLISEENCFLQENACTASHQQVQIALALSPQPVPLMKPVQVSMQVNGLNHLETIELKIEGVNMYMGFQSVQLTKQTDTEWQGSFTLPICSESEMHWQVTANLNSKQQSYQSSFNLVTQR
ncbi:MAG: hypothetical protein WBP46_04220 [Thiolinea sp.]